LRDDIIGGVLQSDGKLFISDFRRPSCTEDRDPVGFISITCSGATPYSGRRDPARSERFCQASKRLIGRRGGSVESDPVILVSRGGECPVLSARSISVCRFQTSSWKRRARRFPCLRVD